MRRTGLVWVIGSVCLLADVGWLAGLRFNLTGSMPVGLYARIPGSPRRGAIVLACLPPQVAAFARSRRYVPRGGCPGGLAPVGKVVLAMPGDTVSVSAEGLSVNGTLVPYSRARAYDSKGRPLSGIAAGRHLVRPGELWLISRHPLGFDSRYFGPLPASSVRGVVRPLWMARGG